MLLFINLFKKKKEKNTAKKVKTTSQKPSKNTERVSNRKGELGEYKIDIQLDQLPKEYRYLSDLLIKNPKAKSGYSQIDHVVITPYGIIVIETKNYQGTIYGGKDRKTWLINGKFKMMNPFVQNYGHIQALKSIVDERYHDFFISMVSFTKRCTFKVDLNYRKIASNELIVYDIELSEFIHRKVSVLKIHHKIPILNEQEIVKIYHIFSNANISDTKIRELHKQALKMDTPKVESTSKLANCEICDKHISEKVRKFCLANERFEGKYYCFECQKNI
jgi:hypothetical protein